LAYTSRRVAHFPSSAYPWMSFAITPCRLASSGDKGVRSSSSELWQERLGGKRYRQLEKVW
jgi:hypothetical protein